MVTKSFLALMMVCFFTVSCARDITPVKAASATAESADSTPPYPGSGNIPVSSDHLEPRL